MTVTGGLSGLWKGFFNSYFTLTADWISVHPHPALL